jgi:hypothetical protein
MTQQNPSQQVLWVLLRVSLANLSKIQPGKAKAAAGQRDQATRHGGLAIGALPIIKKRPCFTLYYMQHVREGILHA